MAKAFILTADVLETARFTLSGICGFEFDTKTTRKVLQAAQRVAPDMPPVDQAAGGEQAPKYPTYIITQEPREVPRRKGPFFGKKMVEDFLREAYRYNPDIVCIVIDMETEDNTWHPEHGYEWLDVNGDRRKRHPRKDRPRSAQPPAPDVELIAKLRTLTSNTGRDHRTGEEFVHGAGSQEVVDALRSALAALQGIPPVQHVAGGRWRVFEAATERGWWGIELEEAGNDDDPILYPVKIGRNRLDALVAAHNDAIASDGAEACAGEHQVVLDAIQSHNSGEDE